MSKSVLITGCSDNGLGAALAVAFHKAGYKVIASARNLKKLGQVTAAGCETIQLDITSEESLKACAAELSKRLDGKLDILVNNAGATCLLPVTDLKLQNVRNLYEVNVFPLISTTQAFLPLLRAAPEGWIINNTSVMAVVPNPMQSAYNSSKAAASSITQALRLELQPFNIKVIELRTGAVDSAIFDNAKQGEVKLPEGSIYAIAKDVINPRMMGSESMKTAIPADTWAQQVVSDLSTTRPPFFIWRGGNAALIKLAIWLPTWIFDSLLIKTMGLDVLKQRLTGSKDK